VYTGLDRSTNHLELIPNGRADALWRKTNQCELHLLFLSRADRYNFMNSINKTEAAFFPSGYAFWWISLSSVLFNRAKTLQRYLFCFWKKIVKTQCQRTASIELFDLNVWTQTGQTTNRPSGLKHMSKIKTETRTHTYLSLN